jgi:hypothetical protein
MRSGDRKEAGRLPAPRGPEPETVAAGYQRNRADKKRRKKNGNPETGFDLRTEAYKLFGVEVTQIPGVETIALPVFSETGRDLSRWPRAARFASWTTLCPENDISGGPVLWRGMGKVKATRCIVVPHHWANTWTHEGETGPARGDYSHRT